ncbi:MAG TPA: hypothetical protein VLD67_06605, partial [Vicinamibacterales bacterium]|nr:hypothetical protein [Vicinamibacterales bacterium]
DLIDYTPEIRQKAYEYAKQNNLFVPIFNPPVVAGRPDSKWPGAGYSCPGGGGGGNIYSPGVADPVQGVYYIASSSGCSEYSLMPGKDSPLDTATPPTGRTHSEWSRAVGAAASRDDNLIRPDRAQIDGLSIWRGPVGRITAIDMNTGEHLWVIPNGEAPQKEQDAIRNHPLLKGVPNVPANRGRAGWSVMTVTPTLLLATGVTSDNKWNLFALDKKTGERLGAVEIPGPTMYGLSSWMHEGRQYVIVQLNDGLAALALPAAKPTTAQRDDRERER